MAHRKNVRAGRRQGRRARWALPLALAATALATAPSGADELAGKRAPADIVAAAGEADWRAVRPDRLAVFELAGGGEIVVEITERFAPANAAQFVSLVRAGFYDGLSFYRVIDGFVAQGGDPFGARALPDGAQAALPGEFEAVAQDGEVSPPLELADDYADATGFRDGFAYGIDRDARTIWPLHCAGAFAFGRENEPDTASSEFYIALQPQRYLDRNMSVFGRVLSGMTHLQALTRQAPPQTDADPVGDRIARVFMADAPPAGRVVPRWRVLRTDGALFAEYVDSRANRPEAFFHVRPDHVNACALAIPAEPVPDGVALPGEAARGVPEDGGVEATDATND